jgi:hypothetical protein
MRDEQQWFKEGVGVSRVPHSSSWQYKIRYEPLRRVGGRPRTRGAFAFLSARPLLLLQP